VTDTSRTVPSGIHANTTDLLVYPTVAELVQKIESVRLSNQGVEVGDLEQIERVDAEIDIANPDALSDSQVAELADLESPIGDP
jgi:hypothetical protein